MSTLILLSLSSFQLDDLRNVKILVCTPELSEKVKKAVNQSKFSYNNATQIICLGKSRDCLNLFELLENVNEYEAVEPVKIDDTAKETLIVYWTSGTTGKTPNNLFLSTGNIILFEIPRTQQIKPLLFSGRPKGICYSHQNVWNCLGNWNNSLPMSNTRSVKLSTQCFFHMGAILGVLEALIQRDTFNHVS